MKKFAPIKKECNNNKLTKGGANKMNQVPSACAQLRQEDVELGALSHVGGGGWMAW